MIDFEKKGRAFTLAEVLITLSILGVVAAIMIPNLIQGYQQKLFATRLRQAYSILDNAFQQAVAVNGHPRTWDITELIKDRNTSTAYFMEKFIMPYLNVAKDCGTGYCSNSSGCFASWDCRSNNNAAVARYYPFNNKNNYSCLACSGNKKDIKLKNGIAISFHIEEYIIGNKVFPPKGVPLGYFIIDLNGSGKPNEFGKDTFALNLFEDGIHVKQYNFASSKSYCSKDSTQNQNGLGCSSYFLQTGKMDYLTKKLVCPEGKTTYPDCYYE